MKHEDRISTVIFLSALALTTAGLFAVGANAGEKIEVGIQKVFIPKIGFDDNDTVEVVLDGILPDGCHTLANQKVSKNLLTKQITIRQFAVKREDELCRYEENIPAYLEAPVPFASEVVLGNLRQGDYTIKTQNSKNETNFRSFNIAEAPVQAVDNMPYASIDNTYIADTAISQDGLEVTFSGMLTSTCMELAPEFVVQRVDDVVVVLPAVNILSNRMCTFIMQPFERKLNLMPLEEGRYLLHTRSLNGKSVNRVFSVYH